MLGRGSELTVWICERNINDNINYAITEWLQEHRDLQIITTRIAGATTFDVNQPHETLLPRWLVTTTRLETDGTYHIWTEENRDPDRLSKYLNKSFERNADALFLDVQIAGSEYVGISETVNWMASPTWILLVIARKR